jgi:HEPN domain-containing protein/predicted nucleotidyltransferase
MIQRAMMDPVLDQMVGAIVEQVRPRRVVLFGSRARGEARADSDYDLMVEFNTDLGYNEAVSVVRDAVRGLEGSVDVLVRKPGELEAQQDDPGRLDWDIAREGIVLYSAANSVADQDSISKRRTDRVREQGEVPPSVRDWLERAEVDLQMIDKALVGGSVPWAGVCFHVQQAAEKYLKVLLIQRMIHPKHTHNIVELVAAVKRAGYEFPDFAEEGKLLEPFSVEIRYPGTMPLPDEATGRATVEAGRRILDAARRFL